MIISKHGKRCKQFNGPQLFSMTLLLSLLIDDCCIIITIRVDQSWINIIVAPPSATLAKH